MNLKYLLIVTLSVCRICILKIASWQGYFFRYVCRCMKYCLTSFVIGKIKPITSFNLLKTMLGFVSKDVSAQMFKRLKK